MFSVFDKLRNIFFSTNSNKRKSNESIEILSENSCKQQNKEIDVNKISVYNHIFKNESTKNSKFNETTEKCQTISSRSCQIDARNDADRIIETIKIKPPMLSTTKRENDSGFVTVSKRTKSTHTDLSHYTFNSKAHLLDRNLIDKLRKPSMYADSRQSQLKILNAESAVIQEEIKKRERTYIEDIAERFRELWWTDPTVIPRVVKKPTLPKITEEMKTLIVTTVKCKKRDSVVVEEFSLSVTVTDIISLQPRQWLTDNIINFYLELINARNNSSSSYPKVQILTSFFYPKLTTAGYGGVKRWTKRRPIFDSQMVLVPIHLGNHWCLVTIDMDNMEVFYYDSLKSPNPRVLNDIKDFLVEDSKDKLNKQLQVADWTFKQKYDGPAQTNGYDCGVFLCQTAEYTARRAKLDFKQEQIDYFREKMSYEIMVRDLL